MVDKIDELLEEKEKEYGDSNDFADSVSQICYGMGIYISGKDFLYIMYAMKKERLRINPEHEDSRNDLEGYERLIKKYIQKEHEKKLKKI